MVYQRNGNGSSIGKLQRYLNRVTKKNILLEAVLTEDSYSKLIKSGPLKKIEASILPPPFAEIEEEGWLRDLIKSFKSDNAKRIKLTLTADSNYPLPDHYKESLANLARAGWAKVARATVMPEKGNIDINDVCLKNEIIDLILNRIKKEFEVELDEKNKFLPKDVFYGLAKAKDECNEQIKFFFTKT
ncbi:hypothetical protein [Comamonas jiangduensis]|uniref:hypothetical protein n=1 Tax=Comamonas jiangduensis TaxID=1194168 RepID=UPI0032AF590F